MCYVLPRLPAVVTLLQDLGHELLRHFVLIHALLALVEPIHIDASLDIRQVGGLFRLTVATDVE